MRGIQLDMEVVGMVVGVELVVGMVLVRVVLRALGVVVVRVVGMDVGRRFYLSAATHSPATSSPG